MNVKTKVHVAMNTSNKAVQEIINPRRACAARVTVLGLSVSLSVKSHLTSEASVRPEIDITYSVGNSQKFVAFCLCSRDMA